jgi:hypothetical protein
MDHHGKRTTSQWSGSRRAELKGSKTWGVPKRTFGQGFGNPPWTPNRSCGPGRQYRISPPGFQPSEDIMRGVTWRGSADPRCWGPRFFVRKSRRPQRRRSLCLLFTFALCLLILSCGSPPLHTRLCVLRFDFDLWLRRAGKTTARWKSRPDKSERCHRQDARLLVT